MKQLFNAQASNRLVGIGAALSALDSGNAVDLSGFIQNQQAMQQQAPMGGGSMGSSMSDTNLLNDEALMAKFTPEQRTMLAQMPRAAAMKIIEQSVFAKPDPTAVWKQNLQQTPFFQGLTPEQQAGIMMLPPKEAQSVMSEMLFQEKEAKERRIITGADGFQYYDDGSRVLPDVQGAPGTVQLSPEEIAQSGLDPSKAYQRKPDGTISAIDGGGVTVNNNTGGSKFAEETDKILAKETAETAAAGAVAQRGLVRIARLEKALAKSPQGMVGGLSAMAGSLGVKIGENASELEVAQAVISSLVPEQRQPGSGPMSDADLELFKLSLPRLINTPEGNRQIISTMREIAQYDIERAAIARKLQLGTISREDAFAAYDQLANPLEGFEDVDDAPEPEQAAAMSFDDFQTKYANNSDVKEALKAGVTLEAIYEQFSGAGQ